MVILQIERTHYLSMLVNVVAAPCAVKTIPESLSHFAKVLEPDISGPGQYLLIDFPRLHGRHWKYPSLPVTSTHERVSEASSGAMKATEMGYIGQEIAVISSTELKSGRGLSRSKTLRVFGVKLEYLRHQSGI